MDVGRLLSRLLRPDRNLVLRVLETQRLTPQDIVSVPPSQPAPCHPGEGDRRQVSPPTSNV
jgi:hypothetical protein